MMIPGPRYFHPLRDTPPPTSLCSSFHPTHRWLELLRSSCLWSINIVGVGRARWWESVHPAKH
ncbi:hypothetical protein BDW59DRAFT_141630 [Aspergillus cavernicola]|uniref:Uncharacterized protein n=1 Tax=Aspergillus cavernicola TaxID=176166 RepID=A0ABR4IQH4_9EURO